MSVQLDRDSIARLKVVKVNDYAAMEDFQVVLACQNQDETAFPELFRRFQRFVRADINKLAPDWSASHDDLTQDVFIKVWRSINQLKNPKAFKGWLHQVTTNLFYDELRRRPRFAVVSLDEPLKYDDEDSSPRQIPDPRSQPDELLERKEIVNQVTAAIESLPSQFKNVIILREIQGMAYEDIAVITGAELGTVKSRIARARTKVSKLITDLRCVS
jgi:RNA polymerase sigma-70 factor (ECF subfamily)